MNSLKNRTLVSIVAPIFNERASLSLLMQRLSLVAEGLAKRYDFEFIFVDDGSQDNSLDVAKELCTSEPRLRVLELRRNYGQTAALQAGLDAAVGEIIISMDADLQHFPENIPSFLDRIEQGCDVVCGWRHQRQEGLIRRWPSLVANLLIRRISGLTIHDIGTTFRAYRREIIKDILLLGEHHRFVPVFASVAGARIDEIPIDNIARPHGNSNYGIARTLNVFIDLFFLLFFTRYLDRPIRIFGKLSLASFGIGSAIATYLTWIWLTTQLSVVREHSGLFTAGIIFYLASVQFITTGVIAELLSRMYFAGPDKSSYKIRNVWGNTSQ